MDTLHFFSHGSLRLHRTSCSLDRPSPVLPSTNNLRHGHRLTKMLPFTTRYERIHDPYVPLGWEWVTPRRSECAPQTSTSQRCPSVSKCQSAILPFSTRSKFAFGQPQKGSTKLLTCFLLFHHSPAPRRFPAPCFLFLHPQQWLLSVPFCNNLVHSSMRRGNWGSSSRSSSEVLGLGGTQHADGLPTSFLSTLGIGNESTSSMFGIMPLTSIRGLKGGLMVGYSARRRDDPAEGDMRPLTRTWTSLRCGSTEETSTIETVYALNPSRIPACGLSPLTEWCRRATSLVHHPGVLVQGWSHGVSARVRLDAVPYPLPQPGIDVAQAQSIFVDGGTRLGETRHRWLCVSRPSWFVEVHAVDTCANVGSRCEAVNVLFLPTHLMPITHRQR